MSVSRAGPVRLSPTVAQQRAYMLIDQGRQEHDRLRSEVEKDLQQLWRGLKGDLVSLAAAIKADQNARGGDAGGRASPRV